MIALVPLLGLASSYGKRGGTRDPRTKKPYAYADLVRTDTLHAQAPERWRCPAGTLRRALALDAAVKAAGGTGIRITECLRSFAGSAEARARYDRWVDAGRPTTKDPEWNSATMSTAYAARAGESEHNWGGAIDLDVYALDFPGLTGNAQLSKLWDLATPLGFDPIIGHPNLDQSECWHFDVLGPLDAVHTMLGRSKDHGRRGNANPITAQVGCMLTGTYQGLKSNERLIQARLLLVGEELDLDGNIGPATKAALARHITVGPKDTPATWLNKLDAARVGFDQLEDA